MQEIRDRSQSTFINPFSQISFTMYKSAPLWQMKNIKPDSRKNMLKSASGIFP